MEWTRVYVGYSVYTDLLRYVEELIGSWAVIGGGVPRSILSGTRTYDVDIIIPGHVYRRLLRKRRLCIIKKFVHKKYGIGVAILSLATDIAWGNCGVFKYSRLGNRFSDLRLHFRVFDYTFNSIYLSSDGYIHGYDTFINDAINKTIRSTHEPLGKPGEIYQIAPTRILRIPDFILERGFKKITKPTIKAIKEFIQSATIQEKEKIINCCKKVYEKRYNWKCTWENIIDLINQSIEKAQEA